MWEYCRGLVMFTVIRKADWSVCVYVNQKPQLISAPGYSSELVTLLVTRDSLKFQFSWDDFQVGVWVSCWLLGLYFTFWHFYSLLDCPQHLSAVPYCLVLSFWGRGLASHLAYTHSCAHTNTPMTEEQAVILPVAGRPRQRQHKHTFPQ